MEIVALCPDVSLHSRLPYVTKTLNSEDLISERDAKLWTKVLNNEKNALRELLPSKLHRTLRRRAHDYELPLVTTK